MRADLKLKMYDSWKGKSIVSTYFMILAIFSLCFSIYYLIYGCYYPMRARATVAELGVINIMFALIIAIISVLHVFVVLVLYIMYPPARYEYKLEINYKVYPADLVCKLIKKYISNYVKKKGFLGRYLLADIPDVGKIYYSEYYCTSLFSKSVNPKVGKIVTDISKTLNKKLEEGYIEKITNDKYVRYIIFILEFLSIGVVIMSSITFELSFSVMFLMVIGMLSLYIFIHLYGRYLRFNHKKTTYLVYLGIEPQEVIARVKERNYSVVKETFIYYILKFNNIDISLMKTKTAYSTIYVYTEDIQKVKEFLKTILMI